MRQIFRLSSQHPISILRGPTLLNNAMMRCFECQSVISNERGEPAATLNMIFSVMWYLMSL
jgi:hypothetical protein